MIVETFAPTRIDLAGGTLDIYPLYVFENGGITVNLAVNLLSYVKIIPREDKTFKLYSEDLNMRAEANSLDELPLNNEFDLISRAIKYYNPPMGLEIITKSSLPKGSGLGASSSLLMSLSEGLNKITGKGSDRRTIIDTGANIEAQSIMIPTGKQDYYAAVFGGLNALWFKMDGVEVEPLLSEEKDLKELEKMIILSYTGESRFSGTNNWEMTKGYIDKKIVKEIHNIKITAEKMRIALLKKDFNEVASLVEEEWENRKKLAPGVTTEKIDTLINTAKQKGALASKICGAGGGGCLLTITVPSKRKDVISALEAGGAKIMNCSVDTKGLRVVERP